MGKKHTVLVMRSGMLTSRLLPTNCGSWCQWGRSDPRDASWRACMAADLVPEELGDGAATHVVAAPGELQLFKALHALCQAGAAAAVRRHLYLCEAKADVNRMNFL